MKTRRPSLSVTVWPRGHCSWPFGVIMMLTCICVVAQQPLMVVSQSRAHSASKCNVTADCPTWFGCNNHSCECQNTPQHIIKCGEGGRAGVLACYCVTTMDENELHGDLPCHYSLVVGSCLFNCGRRPNTSFIDPEHRYFVFSDKVSELNEETCGRFKRTGPLCGKCQPHHYPKVYSFNLNCIECHHVFTKWLLYIFAAFVPLTVFYLVILLLNVNVASSSIHAFVLFCQLVSSPPLARAFANSPNKNPVFVITRMFMTFYGIWNLDFFRFFLPNICLKTSSLVSLSLDYVVAIYPLFLVFVTYLLINMYDRNVKVLVILWKPVKFCLSWFQLERHRAKTTIIDAFVTFFQLSFIKVISVSFDLLYPVPLYTFNSSEVKDVLFYDGSVEYFGKDHLPFAIIAVVLSFIFVIIPVVILLCYPYRCFQRLLNCLPTRWYLILQTFVDATQGCYKNGTEQGSRDCRSFAGLYFVFRIVALLIYVFTLQATFYILCGIFFLLFVMLLLTLNPYKPEFSHYTNLNAGFIVLIATLWFSLTGLSYAPEQQILFLSFALVCWIIPMIYSLYCVFHWLFLRRKKIKMFVASLLASVLGSCCSSSTSDHVLDHEAEESLPHRIVESYQTLSS